MGSPSTGEIYEGVLRNEEDVPLTKEQANWLRDLPVKDRIAELIKIKEQALYDGPKHDNAEQCLSKRI